jgi:hypothetical protein
VKLRRKVPSVDGANTTCPKTDCVAPPQSIGVIDRVAAGQCRMDQGHGLMSHMGPARRIPEVHVLVEQLQQTQVLGQCGRQHETRVGHEMIVVEDHLTPVETVAKSHRESAFLVGVWAALATTIFPFQKGVFADTRHLQRRNIRWIRAKDMTNPTGAPNWRALCHARSIAFATRWIMSGHSAKSKCTFSASHFLLPPGALPTAAAFLLPGRIVG